MLDRGSAGLLAAARAGDGEAFAQLVRPHLDALYAFARRVGPGPEAADDIVQETLVRAWRHLAGFREDAPFRTWLFSIAWRAAKTEARQAARTPEPVGEVLDMAASEPGPEERAVRRDLASRALAALSALSAPQRAAIRAVDLAGRPLAEAARSLGIPLGTLKTNLHRGRRRLAERLRQGEEA